MKLINEHRTDYISGVWTEENVYILLNNGSDTQSGHNSTFYSVNQGQTTAEPQTLTESGIYEIVVTTMDNVGNTATNLYTIKIRKAEKLEIIAKPIKMEYKANENFDPKGMEILVVYDNGDKEATSNYTIINAENLTCKVTNVEIQYNGNSNIKTEIEGINVGHLEVIDKGKEATCTEKGLTEGKHCSNCEEVLEAQTEISEKGHNFKNGECTRCGEKTLPITVESKKYKIDNIYISRIQEKVTVKEVKESIETNATQINIYNKDNELQKDDAKISTGMKIELKLNDEVKTFVLVVNGDIDGDGEIKFADLSMANRYRLKKITLEGAYFRAADVTGDGIVNFKDLVKINRFRLHKIIEL